MKELRALLAEYKHKQEPFPQQREALEVSISKRFFALLMEQGTGKTKVIYDTAAIHFYRGNIDGLLIVAPNDVHEQWIIEQLPAHFPDDITVRAKVWRSTSAKSVRECGELVKNPLRDRFAVLAMNFEAFATSTGPKVAKAFCRTYKTLLVIDECDLAITTPSAQRTKMLVHQIGPLAAMRRIMTGTPAEDPFDLYSPFMFLHPDIHGFTDFQAFKHRYASWEKNYTKVKTKKGAVRLVEYETLQAYQNIGELHAKIAPYTYRKLKKDCMNLPAKIYCPRLVSLSTRQRIVYDELKEEGLILLRGAESKPHSSTPIEVQRLEEVDEDALIETLSNKRGRTTAAIKLTLLLRLHQCVGGFLTDDEGTTRAIDGDKLNPRMQALVSIVEPALKGSAKVLIWACFRAEMAHLKKVLAARGINVEAVYGETHSRTAKQHVIADFKNPCSSLRVLISHEKSLGVGMNFTAAQTVIFYTSGASGRSRVQAEDRCHRIGQSGTVNIYDFNAHEVPIDTRMAQFRSSKLDFNAHVMGWTAEQLEEVI